MWPVAFAFVRLGREIVGTAPATTRILSVGTAVPENKIEPADVLGLAEQLWPRLALAAKAGEGGPTRYFITPLLDAVSERTLTERMAMYSQHGQKLLREAVCKALDGAGVRPDEIDMIISVSCTGYMLPSMDAYLVASLGMRPDVLRLPITELGCSAGTSALGFAHRHLMAHPEHKVLVAAMELPSTQWQNHDRSLDNLIGALIFGDGAGAAVLTGSEGGKDSGLQILSHSSYLVPDTTKNLGYDLRDGGFHLVLSARLPRLLAKVLQPVVEAFEAKTGLPHLDFLALHPGGRDIIDAVEQALALPPELLTHTRRTFQRVGNMSSASIMFVLEDLAKRLPPKPLEGLGIGLGPGVSVELLRMRWRPSPASAG